MKNSILILFLGTFVISIAQVPSKGLISHYPFNGNAKDSTASMNHGTLNGPILTKDRFGNSNSAYQFDGMNDYIDFGSDASLRPNSITVNFWVKISPNNKHMFFMNNVLPGPGTWGFTSFYAIDGTGWRTTVGAGSNDHVLAIKSNLDPDTSKWQMFTSTYDTKSGDLKLYIDCKFISKQNYFGTAGGFNSNDSLQHDTNTNWFFGLHNPRKVLNLDPYYFKGKVDDIRMYNRSLDSTEIKSLFNEPDNNKPTGIEEINNSKVVIYPNPSTEAIKINGINKGSVRILDLNGQLLQVHDYNINDEIKHQLPSGYYFLQILTEGKTINKKLIIN